MMLHSPGTKQAELGLAVMPNPPGTACVSPVPSFDAKLRFLQSASSYPQPDEHLGWVETHMSWLLFTREHVFKLKKPVRFPLLDFTTLQAREFYCREELRLNSRLASGVYLSLIALPVGETGMALIPEERLPAPGQTVEWLVRIRRLPPERMLQQMIIHKRVEAREVDALVAVLASFYRVAARIAVTAQE